MADHSLSRNIQLNQTDKPIYSETYRSCPIRVWAEGDRFLVEYGNVTTLHKNKSFFCCLFITYGLINKGIFAI